MNQKETDADRDEQQQRSGSSKLPFISLASGILATVLFFSPDYFNLGFFSLLLWLVFSIIGFICGLYYLFKYKGEKSLERIYAILGTSICGVWLSIIFIK